MIDLLRNLANFVIVFNNSIQMLKGAEGFLAYTSDFIDILMKKITYQQHIKNHTSAVMGGGGWKANIQF